MNKKISNIVVSLICIVFTIIIFGLCMFGMKTTKREVDNLEKTLDENILRNIYLDNFEEASDYLTDQSREYIRTYDPIYMEKYFEELEGFKRREAAIERLEENGTSEIEINLLKSALDKSNALAEQEIHAMAIVSKLIGYDRERLPQRIKDYEFSDIEKQATADALKKTADNLVNGSKYEADKKEISSYIGRVSELIRMNTEQKSSDAVSNTENALGMLNAYIILLMAVVVLTLAFVIVATKRNKSEKDNPVNIISKEEQ